jgi:SRSO17 transposase
VDERRAAGDQGPWRQQAILGRGRWEADTLRDIVPDFVVETFADAAAVLVIDKTGYLKQGKASCGVGRQYTGSAGKITNCQIGVFATYVSRHGHAFIDRELYLPKSWTDDPVRLAAAHVPEETGFATKPQLAARMIARAIEANVPFSWVAADSVYGVGEIEQELRRAGKGYVLGVSSSHRFHSWGKTPMIGGTAAEIAATRTAADWQRLSAGSGTKGPRLQDWCYLELADLEDETEGDANHGQWTRGLLIRLTSRTVNWPSSQPGARWEPRSKPWSQSKGIAGRSKTVSKPPRTNSGLTIMKPVPGTDGTVTYLW